MKNRTFTLAASLSLMAVLSSCSAETHVPPSPDPIASESSTHEETDISTDTPSSETDSGEAKSFIAGKDYRRDVSNPSHTTIVGEPVLEAEQRFIEAAEKRIEYLTTREDILKAGYKTCNLYREEGNLDGVLDRITAESSNEEEVDILYISGAASKTLCPEYADIE